MLLDKVPAHLGTEVQIHEKVGLGWGGASESAKKQSIRFYRFTG